VGNPAPNEFSTAGERLGLYRQGEKVKPYDPLNEDYKVAPENLEQDSLYDEFKKDASK
jgi:hypothetical protein